MMEPIKISEAQLAELTRLVQDVYKCAKQLALAAIPVMQETSKAFEEFGKVSQNYFETMKYNNHDPKNKR